ncbi:hypothetical protein B0H19DRAFT_18930 [Mycena capillaripes]|nr:hypothetical protein B0H19DRAFT_18930 [Mycena capillaripes]
MLNMLIHPLSFLPCLVLFCSSALSVGAAQHLPKTMIRNTPLPLDIPLYNWLDAPFCCSSREYHCSREIPKSGRFNCLYLPAIFIPWHSLSSLFSAPGRLFLNTYKPFFLSAS